MAHEAATIAFAEWVSLDRKAKYHMTTFVDEGSEGSMFLKHQSANFLKAELYLFHVLEALEP